MWLNVICDICFFQQKTAYVVRISDWSSDVCSSDLMRRRASRTIEELKPPQRPRSAVATTTRWVWSAPEPASSFGAPACPAAASASEPSMRRSEERRVGKSVAVRVDPGGRRILKKNKTTTPPNNHRYNQTHT